MTRRWRWASGLLLLLWPALTVEAARADESSPLRSRWSVKLGAGSSSSSSSAAQGTDERLHLSAMLAHPLMFAGDPSAKGGVVLFFASPYAQYAFGPSPATHSVLVGGQLGLETGWASLAVHSGGAYTGTCTLCAHVGGELGLMLGILSLKADRVFDSTETTLFTGHLDVATLFRLASD